MASQLLADPSDYQKNLKINVVTRNLGYEHIHFNELGRTREEIIAEHAPELLPWLLSYTPRYDGNPTVAEMALRYTSNLTALHTSRLLEKHYGGAHAVVKFELYRRQAELNVVGAIRHCHLVDMERKRHRVAVDTANTRTKVIRTRGR